MNQSRKCPQCSAALPSNALDGLCPQCMARVVFGEGQAAKGNPEEKAAATIRVEPDSDIAIEHVGTTIGRYKLLEQIGEGGFGVVYMAEQIEPVQRKVALKVIKAGMDTKEVIARFEAERQALALMDHPNIARILDAGVTGGSADLPVGESASHAGQKRAAGAAAQAGWKTGVTGRPYFVMELVKGIPITEFCDLKKLSPIERLELFMKVCSAVQHAHQKGIIHRDIKPSNVLVTLHDGEPVPKVIDFGIAKALGPKLTEKTLFTGFAHLLGTPAYMSPEQAELSGLDIDTRSDIYSLGVLLYELLTGVTPFDTKELQKGGYDQVLRTIREMDPLKPSTRLKQVWLNRFGVSPKAEIDSDLDWIVMKCLEKDRNRRYHTANALAMELQRYLNDEPVLARPPSALYRWQKSARKHRLALTVAGGFMVLLSVATGVSLGLALWANRERSRAEHEHTKSVESEAKATTRLWEAYLAQARANRWSSRPGRRFDSLDALAKAAEIRSSIELRDEAIACMTLPDLRQGRLIDAFYPTSTPRALDSKFEVFARSEESGNISIRRVSNDEEVMLIPGPGRRAWNTEFSPKKHFLISTCQPQGGPFPNSLYLWNLESEDIALTLSNAWGGEFSPDERFLIVHLRDEESVIYQLSPLAEATHVDLGRLAYPVSAFSRDGSLLAVSSTEDEEVRIVDVQRGLLMRKLLHPGAVRGLDWHPRRRWLACASADGNVYLWDVDTGQQLQTFQNHQNVASQVQFNQRGDLLLTAAWDSTLRLWEVSNADQLIVMSVQRPLLQFSPDEKLAGLVERNGQFALLEVNTAPECRSLYLRPGTLQSRIRDAQISPDGRLLAAASAEGVRIWDLHTDKDIAFMPTAPVDSVAFLPNQTALLVCGDEGVVLWHFETKPDSEDHIQVGPPRRLLPDAVCRSLSLTGDGRRFAVSRFATAQTETPLQNLIVDFDSITSPLLVKALPNQRAVALSPDGRWLVGGVWRGTKIHLWDAHSGKKISDLTVPDSATEPKFSPDGRWLVAGTAASFHCWKVGSWKPAYDLKPSAIPTSQPSTATFRPDGKMVAVFHRYNRTHLIDAVRGRLLATLDLDRHAPLCFSPDGGSMVMATEKGGLKILDLRIIRRQLAAMNLDWDMPPLPPARPINDPKHLVLTVVSNSPVVSGLRNKH